MPHLHCVPLLRLGMLCLEQVMRGTQVTQIRLRTLCLGHGCVSRLSQQACLPFMRLAALVPDPAYLQLACGLLLRQLLLPLALLLNTDREMCRHMSATCQ